MTKARMATGDVVQLDNFRDLKKKIDPKTILVIEDETKTAKFLKKGASAGRRRPRRRPSWGARPFLLPLPSRSQPLEAESKIWTPFWGAAGANRPKHQPKPQQPQEPQQSLPLQPLPLPLRRTLWKG